MEWEGEARIFTLKNGPLSNIATEFTIQNNSPFTVLGDISMNNSDGVAFRADRFGKPPGTFVENGIDLITIADTTGIFNRFGAGPSIDDNGTVAVLASLDRGGEGIFTISNTEISKVADNSGAISSFSAGLSVNIRFLSQIFLSHRNES